MPKKPVTDPHKAWNIAHHKRLEAYNKRIEALLNRAITQSADLAMRHGAKATANTPFSYSQDRQLKAETEQLLKDLSDEITKVTKQAETKEWEQAYKQSIDYLSSVYNVAKQTEAMQALFDERLVGMKARNLDAFRAFQNRKIGGLKLSDKVWDYTKDFEQQMEVSIDQALLEGKSAEALSRDIRSLLKDPDALFRRVRDDNDQLRMSKAMEAYHPDKGRYRSAYKNAMRLARSEINMAYRSSDYQTAQDFDACVGIRVNLSNNHTCNGKPFVDICDQLSDQDYPKDFKFVGWHPACYSKDSEVLTNDGWKYFSEVDYDDLILSLNPKSRNIEWVMINDIQVYKHNGEMIHFFNKSLDCLVTPEHQMVYLNKSDGRIKTCVASEYRKGFGAFYRSCEYDAPDIDSISINGKEYDFDTFCEFMAYYLSDGSTQHNSGINIAQKDGQPYKNTIANCIRRLGYEPKSRNYTLNFFDSKLNQYLKQFGTAHDKFIPEEIKKASKRQIKIFLDAYTRCDGYKRNRKEARFVGSHGHDFAQKSEERLYYTISNVMVRDLSELILKSGHRPSFRCIEPRTSQISDGRTIKSNYPCWVISECYSTTATVFEKESVPYDDYVYDLTLERNHIIYIRRNGKCFWGSNCRCFITYILKTDEEFWRDIEDGVNRESVNTVHDVPDQFKEWVANNEERIARAEERGTLPYFLRDNQKYTKQQIEPQEKPHFFTHPVSGKTIQVDIPFDERFPKEVNVTEDEAISSLRTLKDRERIFVFTKDGRVFNFGATSEEPLKIDLSVLNAEAYKGATAIHNHPDGGSFSYNDIESFLSYKMKKAIVVSDKDDSILSIVRTNSNDVSIKDFNRDWVDRSIFWQLRMPKAGAYAVNTKIIEELSKKYGFAISKS